MVRNWQIAPHKIKVLPNLFSPSRELLQIPIQKESDNKRIVFFGRLNVLKGLVNATRSMKEILKKYPDWHFRIIGDDGPGPKNNNPMRTWMKNHLVEVESRVEFMDGLAYDKLPAAISDCDIVLLPSLFESFSYTCAEAMAAGKAIVGSKKGGFALRIASCLSFLPVFLEEMLLPAMEELAGLLAKSSFFGFQVLKGLQPVHANNPVDKTCTNRDLSTENRPGRRLSPLPSHREQGALHMHLSGASGCCAKRNDGCAQKMATPTTTTMYS